MSGALPAVLLAWACSGGDPPDGPPRQPAASPVSPADTDTGTPPDPGTDTGTPPGAGDRVFDEAHVLVIPDATGLHLMDRDGTLAWSQPWDGLVGPCFGCGGEGASADGDGLLVSFTDSSGFSGSVARLRPGGALEFRVDGFVFPHDAVRDPLDGTIVVPETTANRILWIPGDGSSPEPVRAIGLQTPGGEEELPNGLERLDHQGRSYLLVTYRGAPFPTTGPDGRIALWDVTTAEPTVVWRFPADGPLDTPHGAILREWRGRWWLLWAHTEGGDAGGGSVGLAVTDDPALPPAYVADLVPPEPFLYLRGVELTSDGELYLTDSGTLWVDGADANGRVVRADMPMLSPTGATGVAGEDQVFVDLPGQELLLDRLAAPFEGWLWAWSWESAR